MAVDVRYTYYPAEVTRLQRETNFIAGMMAEVRPVVLAARAKAPKRTGRGVASITAEAILDGPFLEIDVSWTREYYYMHMHERGTVHMGPRPFLVPALEGATR